MQAFVAPWTSLSPLSFVEAAKAGAALGQQIKENSDRTALGYAGINSENSRAAAQLAANQSMQQQSLGSAAAINQATLGQKTAAEQLTDKLARDKMIQDSILENRHMDIYSNLVDSKSQTAAGRLEAEQARTDAITNASNVKLSQLSPLERDARLAVINRNTNWTPDQVNTYIHTGSTNEPASTSIIPPSAADGLVQPPNRSTLPASPASPSSSPQLTQPTAQPTAALTPDQKAAKANDIAAGNPTLSREEILALVNKL
jgi:hypothetical protein